MKKKTAFITITVIIAITGAIYLLFDYYNIPTYLGLSTSNFNFEVMGIISTFTITAVVFLLTYCFVDAWSVRKQKNQKEIGLFLLSQVFSECKTWTLRLHNGIIDTLVKKTDFNAYYDQNSPGYKFAQIPFENEDLIMKYAEDGALDKEIVEAFLKIKDDFHKHVSLSITFFDHTELVYPDERTLVKEIENAEEMLQRLQEVK